MDLPDVECCHRFTGEWHVVAWVPAGIDGNAPRADKCMSANFSADNPRRAKVCVVTNP